MVAPHRNFGVAIDVATPADRTTEPVGARNPAILYGLGNLLENAVDFARDRVVSRCRLGRGLRRGHHHRRRAGFAPEIMARIGEPYVTTRSRRHLQNDTGDEPTGLGLGFFIAKTLLERSGATLSFENRAAPEHGAIIRLHWSRSDFERPLTFAAA